jgi:predicted choloylglycine hydrolase
VTHLSEAFERHLASTPRLAEDLPELVGSQELADAMLSGQHQANLYEATLLAAYCKTSVAEFFELDSSEKGK